MLYVGKSSAYFVLRAPDDESNARLVGVCVCVTVLTSVQCNASTLIVAMSELKLIFARPANRFHSF